MGLGCDIVYSRREKIICPPVIGLFYGSVSLKGREMKADKEYKADESSEDMLVLPSFASSLLSSLHSLPGCGK